MPLDDIIKDSKEDKRHNAIYYIGSIMTLGMPKTIKHFGKTFGSLVESIDSFDDHEPVHEVRIVYGMIDLLATATVIASQVALLSYGSYKILESISR